MNEATAYKLITDAIVKVAPAQAGKISMSTDLLGDSILDSLDVMSFLFEVEEKLGKKLTAIDETYSDFRISSIVQIVCQA
jgi:acyl carrier protein